jgi:hypothetical protein
MKLVTKHWEATFCKRPLWVGLGQRLRGRERTFAPAVQGGEMPLRLHDDLHFCAIGEVPHLPMQ